MNRAFRRTLLALLLCGLAVGLAVAATWAYSLHQRLNAKETQAWMSNLWAVCVSSNARNLDEVMAECRRSGATCVPNDAWGRPFVVERLPSPASDPDCRVVSLGRDGRRGSCCRRDLGWDWDADAVYGKDGRLQGWSSLSSGKERRPAS